MTSITFTAGIPLPPSPVMTRAELTTWLLCLSSADLPRPGLGALPSRRVAALLADLPCQAQDQALLVTLPGNIRYEVSAAKSGPWYRRMVTYHARKLPAPVRPEWLYSFAGPGL